MTYAPCNTENCIMSEKYDQFDNDSKDIVKLLCLPTSLYKHVIHEFEYQVQLQFHICIEPTINYKYPNEF